MEIFNPQFLAQYSKLDSIQVVQLLMLVLVGGMMWLNVRQQGVAKQTAQNFNDMTSKLLGNMQTQQMQSNDRESKLATAIDRGANESNKIARALLLIHKEQKRQGEVMDDTQETLDRYHAETLKRIDDVAKALTMEINGLKQVVNREPGQHTEMMQSINRVLGYVEGMRLKINAGKLATGERMKAALPPDARSDDPPGATVEASDTPN